MQHIFISYCREDAEFAHLLEQQLNLAGYSTWRDVSLNAGDDWRVEIDTGIREAIAVILVLSPASLNSPYVNYEWAFALGSGLPVFVVGVEATESDPHSRLHSLGFFDFSDRSARPWTLLVEALRELNDPLGTATVHVPRDAPPPVKAAAQALDSLDSAERAGGLESLAELKHPSAIGILAGALRHPIQQVRYGAAVILAERHDARAVPVLIEGLQDCKSPIHSSMLEGFGDSVASDLISLMADKSDHATNRAVCLALGSSGSAAAAAAILPQLKDPDPELRAIAASGLASAAEPSAIPALLDASRDPDASVRREVMHALVASAEKAANVEALHSRLIEALGDPNPDVVNLAIRGLEKMRDPASVPHMVRTLVAHPAEWVRLSARGALVPFETAAAPYLRSAAADEDPLIRSRAIEQFGHLKDAGSLPLVLEAARHSSRDVRLAAIGALERLANAAAVPALIALVDDDDSAVVRRATYALRVFDDRSAVPKLMECLDDGDPKIVRVAIIALEGKADAAAVPRLIGFLFDDDLDSVAAETLEKIGTKEARSAVKAWNQRMAK